MSTHKQITIHALNSLKKINDAIDVVKDEINKAYETAKKRDKISAKERIGKRNRNLQSLCKIRRKVKIANADAQKGSADPEKLIQNFEEIEYQLRKRRIELSISRKAKKSIKTARDEITHFREFLK